MGARPDSRSAPILAYGGTNPKHHARQPACYDELTQPNEFQNVGRILPDMR